MEPSGSVPVSRKPTTCGTSIETASPSIAASASMPPTPQPSTPRPLTIVVCESVPTQRVRERLSVPVLDDAGEELEVDLVDDAGGGRDHRQAVERLLAETEERVALAVALELELGVSRHRAAGREGVDLHGVVDDEVRGQLGVDADGVAAEVAHRVAHGDEVDDRRHAREVLVEDARGREAQLT